MTFKKVVDVLTGKDTSAKPIPRTHGVYIILDHQDKPWYFGKAQNLRERTIRHLKPLRDFDGFGAVDNILDQKFIWGTLPNNKKNDIGNVRSSTMLGTYHPKSPVMRKEDALIAIAEQCLIQKLRTYHCGHWVQDKIYYDRSGSRTLATTLNCDLPLRFRSRPCPEFTLAKIPMARS